MMFRRSFFNSASQSINMNGLVVRILPRCLPGSRFFSFKGDPSAPVEKAAPLYLKKYHEPKYLELLKPQIPFYELVNFKVRGYDHVVLEEYVRFIQKTASHLSINHTKFWAVPPVSLKQDTLQATSELVSSSETVKIHERTVQVKHMTSKVCSIFLDAVKAAKPPLVTLHVSEHKQEDEEVRYIPDLLLLGMEKELDELKSQPVSVLTGVKTKQK